MADQHIRYGRHPVSGSSSKVSGMISWETIYRANLCSGGGIVSVGKDADGFKTGENVILGGRFVRLFAFAVLVAATDLLH